MNTDLFATISMFDKFDRLMAEVSPTCFGNKVLDAIRDESHGVAPDIKRVIKLCPKKDDRKWIADFICQPYVADVLINICVENDLAKHGMDNIAVHETGARMFANQIVKSDLFVKKFLEIFG